MTIAELHGKLSASNPNGAFERMEDLLTSDVFGTMKYVSWENGFIDWLLKSEHAPIYPNSFPIQSYLIKSEIKSFEYSFWPRLKNNREPDLAMCVVNKDSTILIVLIEAKYFSGMSDWENDSFAGPLGLSGNQIADQISGLNSISNDELNKWFPNLKKLSLLSSNTVIKKIHLLVTMHFCLPEYVYTDAITHITDDMTIPAYWLSWNSLAACLESEIKKSGTNDTNNLLLSDLYQLLHRKGLTPFDGFNAKLWHSNISPSFWQENLWVMKPINIGAYRSFFIS